MIERTLISERVGRDGYYIIREEMWDAGGEPHPMTYCYTPDGDTIGRLDDAKALCDVRGIKPRPRLDEHVGTGHQCSIGFCDKEQKWYGWSHRAIYGFGVGSKVVKGDCAYVAATPEDLIDQHAEFYADISKEKAALRRAECQILPDRSGIRILHAPLKVPMAGSMEEALDPDLDPASLPEVDIHEDAVSIILCGRGEWAAATLDDAKEMAQAFAESVS